MLTLQKICNVTSQMLRTRLRSLLRNTKSIPWQKRIKGRFGDNNTFLLGVVSLVTIFKEIIFLDFNKASITIMHQLRCLKKISVYLQFMYLKCRMNLSFLGFLDLLSNKLTLHQFIKSNRYLTNPTKDQFVW